MDDSTPKSSPPAGGQTSVEELWQKNEEFIRSLAERVSYVRPEYADRKHFIDSTFSRAYEKFIKGLHTFDGTNWEGWLYRLVRSAAGDEVRSIVGRHEAPPVFVDLAEVNLISLWEPKAGLRQAEHAVMIDRLLEIHSQQSTRGLTSAEAIRMRWFENKTTDQIAQQLRKSKDSVYQIFSHDYKALKAMCWARFGVSGTDL